MFWAFLCGFVDSLRGTIHLFFLDQASNRIKEENIIKRESRKELLLNRQSPARDIENFAKRRALERREREGLSRSMKPMKRESTVLEKTMKCCLLNGLVFLCSILFFDAILLPTIEGVLFYALGHPDLADDLWAWTKPILSLTFSTLWISPLFFLSKIVNALWFQDIANLAFKSTKSRQQTMSFSKMLADNIFSILVEVVFLGQGMVFSFVPIPLLGVMLNLFHLCLLNSLYSFEYKWFNQGLELHNRLHNIETNWPYFLGFGLPLALVTSMPEGYFVSGCLFSVLFPLFIVSANQAHVVKVPGAEDSVIHIFKPTIVISNRICLMLDRFRPAKNRPKSTA